MNDRNGGISCIREWAGKRTIGSQDFVNFWRREQWHRKLHHRRPTVFFVFLTKRWGVKCQVSEFHTPPSCPTQYIPGGKSDVFNLSLDRSATDQYVQNRVSGYVGLLASTASFWTILMSVWYPMRLSLLNGGHGYRSSQYVAMVLMNINTLKPMSNPIDRRICEAGNFRERNVELLQIIYLHSESFWEPFLCIHFNESKKGFY